jgi:RsiW-degrading membrane proteinase PrsW (M82 family)
MDWYYRDGDKQIGPVPDDDMAALIKSGAIGSSTPVWREGMADWEVASSSDLKTHFVSQQPRPSTPPPLRKAGQAASTLAAASQHHAKTVIDDLRQMDWKAEVLPIDRSNIALLMRDIVFWSVTLLGVIPLLIVTIENTNAQLTAFALFFAGIWGFLFRKFILKGTADWKHLIGTLLFTGIVGINILLWLYRHVFPRSYLRLSHSDSLVVSLLGFILQVGIWEELCKVLPVLLFLVWKRRTVSPSTLVAIGVFSGLGFAAFENVSYGQQSVLSSYSLAMRYGGRGLVAGVNNAMVTAMLRSLSLVFCHAVWAGTFAYFMSVAAATHRRWGALFVVGLAVSAILHGAYDWFAGLQPTASALLAGLSFVLFYGYVSKLRTYESVRNGDASTAAT